MNANGVIESDVPEVARELPRRKRADVAAKQRSLPTA